MNDAKLLVMLRQTGRTTRMIQTAMHFAKAGKTVYVIFPNELEIVANQPKWGGVLWNKFNELKNKVEDEMLPKLIFGTVAEAVNVLIEPKTFRPVKGLEKENALIFLDHSVIETEFAFQLRVLHSFDKTLHLTQLVTL